MVTESQDRTSSSRLEGGRLPENRRLKVLKDVYFAVSGIIAGQLAQVPGGETGALALFGLSGLLTFMSAAARVNEQLPDARIRDTGRGAEVMTREIGRNVITFLTSAFISSTNFQYVEPDFVFGAVPEAIAQGTSWAASQGAAGVNEVAGGVSSVAHAIWDETIDTKIANDIGNGIESLLSSMGTTAGDDGEEVADTGVYQETSEGVKNFKYYAAAITATIQVGPSCRRKVGSKCSSQICGYF